MHVRCIPIEEVPVEAPLVEEWVWDSFNRKQELITHFKKHGSFPGEAFSLPLELGAADKPTFEDLSPEPEDPRPKRA